MGGEATFADNEQVLWAIPLWRIIRSIIVTVFGFFEAMKVLEHTNYFKMDCKPWWWAVKVWFWVELKFKWQDTRHKFKVSHEQNEIWECNS